MPMRDVGRDDRTTEEKYLDTRIKMIYGKGSQSKKEWDKLEKEAKALQEQQKREQGGRRR